MWECRSKYGADDWTEGGTRKQVKSGATTSTLCGTRESGCKMATMYEQQEGSEEEAKRHERNDGRAGSERLQDGLGGRIRRNGSGLDASMLQESAPSLQQMCYTKFARPASDGA